MTVRCTIDPSSQHSAFEVQNGESTVVQEARRLLNSANEEELNKIEEIVEMRRNDITLAGVKNGSMILLLWCHELSGLKRLHDWLRKGRMREIVEELFNRLLKTSQESRLPVVIKWKEKEYKRCVKYFDIARGIHTSNTHI